MGDIDQVSERLSQERKGQVHPWSGSTAGQEFRNAIHALGNHHQWHPNYLTSAAPQTTPTGRPRAQDTYDLEERINFNPRPRQQMWAPPSAAQSSGVPEHKKDYSLVTDPAESAMSHRYPEIIIGSILVVTFLVLFY